MKCLDPVLITVEKKDAFDHTHTHKMYVPCGKCAACLSKRRDDWVFRLKQEFLSSSSSHFVTLTYDDLAVPKTDDGTMTLCMDDVSAFMKRLRNHAKGIKFFACGEYGSQTNRPHYHLLLFHCPDKIEELVKSLWFFGHVRVDPLNEARIAYTCKYVLSSVKTQEGVPFTIGSRGMDVNVPLSVVVNDLQLDAATLLSVKRITLLHPKGF